MFKIFRKSQRRLDEIKQQQARQQRDIERNVCAIVARGNISLQRGEYITRQDLDKLQDELTAYFSSERSKWR